MEILDRTFGILELFLDNREALSITEISRLTNLSPAVTHRIVTDLSKKGYLAQKEKRGKYSLGLAFLSFSYAIQYNTKIANLAFPALLQLNNDIDEAVVLTILDGREVVVIERIDARHNLRVNTGVGKRAPIFSSATGKIFLSQMPAAERQDIFNSLTPADKFTRNTITDYAGMEQELEIFKTEGCTYDREETAMGIWSVAAPVYGITGKIEAGVSINVPSARVGEHNAPNLAAQTKACAAAISRALGYRG